MRQEYAEGVACAGGRGVHVGCGFGIGYVPLLAGDLVEKTRSYSPGFKRPGLSAPPKKRGICRQPFYVSVPSNNPTARKLICLFAI